MFRGNLLPPGKAARQFDTFISVYDGREHPMAVCYKIDEFETMIAETKAMFSRLSVPRDQWGIALTPGIHLDPDSSHAHNKITLMMVATQWIDSQDPKAGKVEAINSPILTRGWTELGLKTPPPLEDISFDAGSLWP